MAGATIVFCDIVGFSQHSNDRQGELIYSLNADVTHQLYAYLSGTEPTPRVIGLPTGDGIAIALLDQERDGQSPWTPVLFALLDRLMRWAGERTKLRVGVHSGPISVISDINRRPNVCGATVNVCQRIMDAAHPNQVLFSATAYHQYVGGGHTVYSDAPFSAAAPAKFKGPINIVAKHGTTVPVYVMSREATDTTWVELEPYPRGMLLGKIPRAQFIVDRLEGLLVRRDRVLSIYEQSAFSTFGISRSQELWRTIPGYSDEYYRLILLQRDLLDRLVREDRTTLRLIVNPSARAYDAPRMHARLSNLLAWMTDDGISTNGRVDFVNALYDGPNRLIVDREFCIEGFKLHDATGYELSIVHTDERAIGDAIDAFKRVFQRARAEGNTKESARDTIGDLSLAHSPRLRKARGSRRARSAGTK